MKRKKYYVRSIPATEDAIRVMLSMGEPLRSLNIDQGSFDCDYPKCRVFADVENIHVHGVQKLCRKHDKELRKIRAERKGL